MTTENQLETLISYLEENSNIIFGKVTGFVTLAKKKKCWQELATRLNTLPGCQKTAEGWQKFYNEIKNVARGDAMAVHKYLHQTGGAEPLNRFVDDYQMRLIALAKKGSFIPLEGVSDSAAAQLEHIIQGKQLVSAGDVPEPLLNYLLTNGKATYTTAPNGLRGVALHSKTTSGTSAVARKPTLTWGAPSKSSTSASTPLRKATWQKPCPEYTGISSLPNHKEFGSQVHPRPGERESKNSEHGSTNEVHSICGIVDDGGPFKQKDDGAVAGNRATIAKKVPPCIDLSDEILNLPSTEVAAEPPQTPTTKTNDEIMSWHQSPVVSSPRPLLPTNLLDMSDLGDFDTELSIINHPVVALPPAGSEEAKGAAKRGKANSISAKSSRKGTQDDSSKPTSKALSRFALRKSSDVRNQMLETCQKIVLNQEQTYALERERFEESKRRASVQETIEMERLQLAKRKLDLMEKKNESDKRSRRE